VAHGQAEAVKLLLVGAANQIIRQSAAGLTLMANSMRIRSHAVSHPRSIPHGDMILADSQSCEAEHRCNTWPQAGNIRPVPCESTKKPKTMTSYIPQALALSQTITQQSKASHPECYVDLLLMQSHGASVDAQDHQGLTALDIAPTASVASILLAAFNETTAAATTIQRAIKVSCSHSIALVTL